jgi:Domain of unknown function (DUF4440)/Domain of unknown function (DUF3471)
MTCSTAMLALGLMAASLSSSSCTFRNHPAIAQDDLVRNAQAMFDAVAAGDQEPWKKHFADDSMYFDEKGRSMDKAALVKDVTPLPPGYSGAIKVVNPKSNIQGDTAVLSYDLNETETIFGQNMTARYHGTDTWMYRDGKWQIVAGQMFRYYEDPAVGKGDVKEYADYAGTYELAPGKTQIVFVRGGSLYARRGDGPEAELVPEAAEIFFRKGVEGRCLFRRDDRGKVDAMIDRRNNEDVVWKKVG